MLAGLGGLLAIALIGGGVWYAASQKPEPKEPTPIEQTEKQEQQVIQLGAKADGWVKGESSPVIAHIVNKEEKVDYYHAYDANEPHALDVRGPVSTRSPSSARWIRTAPPTRCRRQPR